jgi:hypothetical protein
MTRFTERKFPRAERWTRCGEHKTCFAASGNRFAGCRKRLRMFAERSVAVAILFVAFENFDFASMQRCTAFG